LDVIRFNRYDLLGIALKNPGLLCLAAQPLNRFFHGGLLRYIRLPKSSSPIRVLRHHLKDLRIMRECLNADIPRLRFDETLIHLAVQKRLRLRNLVPETCGRQNLSQQRIRIKSNRREHLIQFACAIGGLCILWTCIGNLQGG
jgi:hypothetical protein